MINYDAFVALEICRRSLFRDLENRDACRRASHGFRAAGDEPQRRSSTDVHSQKKRSPTSGRS